MKIILIGERYRSKLEKSIENQGFEPIWMPDNPLLDPRLAGHADLSAIKLGEKLVVSRHLAGDSNFVKIITNRGLNVILCEGEQSCEYPKDIGLCACVLGKHIIHNFRYTDGAIIENCELRRINVNQGYSKCMILALDEIGLISSDKGICTAARENGIKVLQIRSGHIKLEGFSEGFIGGASFVYDDTVYFTGELERHPDSAEIVAFITAAGYKTVCLTNYELFDIGGAVII